MSEYNFHTNGDVLRMDAGGEEYLGFLDETGRFIWDAESKSNKDELAEMEIRRALKQTLYEWAIKRIKWVPTKKHIAFVFSEFSTSRILYERIIVALKSELGLERHGPGAYKRGVTKL